MSNEEEKTFVIVNPKGIMHVVTESHARERLTQIGFRLATKEERDAYFEAGGNQRFDRPLAKPFSPDPLAEMALEGYEIPKKKAGKVQGKAEVTSVPESSD